MQTKPASRMQVVRKEEKLSRLVAFIEKDLDGLAAQRPNGSASLERPVVYRLVARSATSPVVLALAGLADRLAEACIEVEAILSCHVEREPGAGLPLAAPLEASQVRVARTHRLSDAHEQLLLGATTVWIGDCMRREPDKRDAYECYSTDCTVTAAWAATSFARLWHICRPYTVLPVVAPLAATVDPDLVTAPLPAGAIAGEEPPTATGATRH